MTIQVKSSKLKGKCNRKNFASRRTNSVRGRATTSVVANKLVVPVKAKTVEVNKTKAMRMLYCRMYEQEEKDIAKAVIVLEKFSRRT